MTLPVKRPLRILVYHDLKTHSRPLRNTFNALATTDVSCLLSDTQPAHAVAGHVGVGVVPYLLFAVVGNLFTPNVGTAHRVSVLLVLVDPLEQCS
eukprot:1136923-Pelagomonas_calceolata.AAC.2